MPIRFKLLCAAACLIAAPAGHAAELFRVNAAGSNESVGSQGFRTAGQALDGLRSDGLRLLLPGYSEDLEVLIGMNYRGMLIDARFPIESSELEFQIAALGIRRTFSGETRDDSVQLLRDYLQRGEAASRIRAHLVASSPVDPLAGNPSSLQTRTVRGRFDRDFTALVHERTPVVPETSDADTPGGVTPTGTATTARPAAGRHVNGSFRTASLELPFSQAFDTGPGRPLSVDANLQFSDTEGATSYGLQVGAAYRVPVSERWTLVPGASLGFTRSHDLDAEGSLAALSLTSALRLVEAADYTLWMGNAVSWTRTLHTPGSDGGADPNLRNWVSTNGLMLSLAPGALVRDRWIELSLTDSRYHGSALYNRRYDEVGVALVNARRSGNGVTTWRFELSYLDATRSRGLTARLSASF